MGVFLLENELHSSPLGLLGHGQLLTRAEETAELTGTEAELALNTMHPIIWWVGIIANCASP